MNVDLLIRGGRVIDPLRNIDGPEDIFIQGDKIVKVAPNEKLKAEQIIDAGDCLVLPGLIDFHTHLFAKGTEIGVLPDSALLHQGVTTAVDAGSAGIANYDNFANSIVAGSQVRIFSYLNVSPTGLVTTRYHENVNPKHFDYSRIAYLMEYYKGQLLGLKIRQGKEIVGELGLEPLKATLKMADALACPVVVHTTNPPVSPEEMANLLRPGDIFCHVYHGKGDTIIGKDGEIRPGILSARNRGVIFDAANGRNNFALVTARAALADGFLPDIISTDLTINTLYRDYVFGLPAIISKYLNLGIPLRDTVAACTAKPADTLGLKGKIGTMNAGAYADIAIFRLKAHSMVFRDSEGETFKGEKLLIPQLTILGGKVVYRQIDF
jgi:dihydroorotase